MRQIAERISRAGIEGLFGAEGSVHNGSERDTPKKLDVVAVSPSMSSHILAHQETAPALCEVNHRYLSVSQVQLWKAHKSIGRTECGMWMSCTVSNPTTLLATVPAVSLAHILLADSSILALQNEILKAALASSGRVAAMASEEDDSAIAVDAGNDRNAASRGPPYAAVFDPLDGSSNIDACIPTGTILGLYKATGVLFQSTHWQSPVFCALLSPTPIFLQKTFWRGR